MPVSTHSASFLPGLINLENVLMCVTHHRSDLSG